MLVTTHYLDEAERCDRVAIIHAGRLAALGTTSELKSRFDDRPIFEVRASDPVAAMTALDEKTSLFGTTVHAVGRTRQTNAADLTAALSAAGLRVAGMGAVVPSLEDVFLDVVDHLTERGAA